MSGSWAWRGAAILGTIYVFLALGPLTLTMPRSGLDPAWASLLAYAWVQNWRWGVDVIDNFGPYGFLYPQEFRPELVGTLLSFNVALAAVVTATWILLIRGYSVAMKIVTTCILLLALALRRDVLLIAVPLLLLLAQFKPKPLPASLRLSLVAATGLVSLIKWTALVASLPALLAVDLDQLRWRSLPWHLPACFVVIAALYCAAGQRPSDLSEMVRLVSDQTAGFSDAMAIAGPPWEVELFYLFAGIGVGVLGWSAWASSRDALRTTLLMGGCAFLLFVAFKAGFVRHDPTHSVTGWAMLALLALGTLVLPARSGVRGTAALFLGSGALAVAYVVDPQPVFQHVSLALLTKPAKAAGDAIGIAWDWDRWRAAKEAEWEGARAEIRGANPIAVNGTIDSIPPLQAAILASGADYHPRPTLQEHQAYTPMTLAADEAFFRSPDAPEFLLFQPGSIDNRYPTVTEGALWPTFLTQYAPQQLLGDAIVLHRRSDRQQLPLLGTPHHERGVLDRWMSLSATTPAAFVRINLRATIQGNKIALLFRPPILEIGVRLADGRELRHRLPRGLAEAGFVLSPYVSTSSDYAALANGLEAPVESLAVTDFRLFVEQGRSGEYSPEFDVEIIPMELSALSRSR